MAGALGGRRGDLGEVPPALVFDAPPLEPEEEPARRHLEAQRAPDIDRGLAVVERNVERELARDLLRVVFIGGATRFGVGALAPFLLRPWVGEMPAEMVGALGTLCAGSFLVGLVSVTLIERIIARTQEETNAD